KLLIRLASIERGIVLAGHETHGLDLEPIDDLLELRQSLPSKVGVIGGVGEISGEDDEVGLALKCIHPFDRVFERHIGFGIGRTLEAPMGVRELQEVEVIRGLAFRTARGATAELAEAGRKDYAPHSRPEQL